MRQQVRVDRDGQVGSFSGHRRSVGPIQPLAANLAQGVGAALRGCPVVVLATRTGLRVEHGPQRR